MLSDIDASANLAVKDLAVARTFYERTLGLTRVGSEGNELIVYRSGKTTINVYTSKEAGTNRATAVTWAVSGGVEGVVRALKARALAQSCGSARGGRVDWSPLATRLPPRRS